VILGNIMVSNICFTV